VTATCMRSWGLAALDQQSTFAAEETRSIDQKGDLVPPAPARLATSKESARRHADLFWNRGGGQTTSVL